MNLSVGIVGLPNVGKSTTFNALTKSQNAQAANYPFCTIEPNKAVVPVPDRRIDELSKLISPQKVQYSTVEFVDIAGLVKGASKGEGLGNQFLSNIREVEVILHMVRCFDNEDITHVEESINPIRDIEIIETELIFADIQSLDKKIERLTKQAKSDKSAKSMLDIATEIKTHLDSLKPVSNFGKQDNDDFISLNKELRFLSNKTIIYIANVSENDIEENIDNDYVKALIQHSDKLDTSIVKICASMEEELISLSDEEAKEFLADMNVSESGLDKIARVSFNALNLISYFTAGVKEVRAWTIPKDTLAPRAAAAIHNDFEKGFIKAEVISYNDFVQCGGEAKAKESGKLRLEGKEYVVQDGDIMHFKFNV
jgi:GTP-binding protein YchF